MNYTHTNFNNFHNFSKLKMNSKVVGLGLCNNPYPPTFRAFPSTLKNVSFSGWAADNPEILLTQFRIALNPGSVRIELEDTMHILEIKIQRTSKCRVCSMTIILVQHVHVWLWTDVGLVKLWHRHNSVPAMFDCASYAEAGESVRGNMLSAQLL
jgi:hypothetical protein